MYTHIHKYVSICINIVVIVITIIISSGSVAYMHSAPPVPLRGRAAPRSTLPIISWYDSTVVIYCSMICYIMVYYSIPVCHTIS